MGYTERICRRRFGVAVGVGAIRQGAIRTGLGLGLFCLAVTTPGRLLAQATAAPVPSAIDQATEIKEDDGIPKGLDGRRVLKRQDWYYKFSGNLNYFNMGDGFNQAIGQIEGLFNGQKVTLPLLVFNTSLSIKTKETVKRAPTHFLPTGNLGFGYRFGKNAIEVDFGLAGMVPLNTIQTDSPMVLTEGQLCDSDKLDNCPLAKLGFVNRSTGKGKYRLKATLNEDIWILTPAVYYEYTVATLPWAQIAAGGSLGLFFFTAKQKVTFYAKRTDTPDEDYADRVMQGSAMSTAMNDVGPIVRLYASFRRALIPGTLSDLRLGFNYGFLTLHRSVDGSGAAILGDTMVASFPTTSLGFKNEDKTKLEMAGFFIQAGMVF